MVLEGGGAGAAAGVLLDALSPPLLPLSLLAGALGVLVLVLLLVEDFDSPPDFLFEPPLYRSAYQPEPLRMKLAELMRRRTASAPHDGHTFTGSSDMRCTCSKAWPQALH